MIGNSVLLALALLVIPAIILGVQRLRERGLELESLTFRSALSVLAVVALVWLVAWTLSPAAAGLVEGPRSFNRVFFLFLISGIALGVAIFPGQAVAMMSDGSGRLGDLRAEWVFLLPAWGWIAVMAFLVQAGFFR